MTEGNTTPINQCDGCLRGLPLIDGIHKGEGRDMMSCTKEKYTPIEKKSCKHSGTIVGTLKGIKCMQCEEIISTDIDTGWERIETLAHAYQEGEQPANDFESGCSWGAGYWKGIEFVKSCLPELLISHERTVTERVLRDMKKKMYEWHGRGHAMVDDYAQSLGITLSDKRDTV